MRRYGLIDIEGRYLELGDIALYPDTNNLYNNICQVSSEILILHTIVPPVFLISSYGVPLAQRASYYS